MPTSWLAFGTGVLEAAWTAAADATNDADAGAHNRATIPTLRAAAPTLALKVLVMAPLLEPPRRHISNRRGGILGIFRKGSGRPYRASFMETWRKSCNATRTLEEALSGVESPSGKRWRQELGGWLSWKNDADH
jgi:hypothetical protein